VHAPETRQYTLWFVYRGPLYIFVLTYYVSIVKYLLIIRYRVRTKRNEESLWFGLRLFPVKRRGQYLYPIANKITQRNNSCFIWTHSEIPFAFHEAHTFYSTFPWNKNELYRRTESMITLFVNISAS
jgi:hypothetical protein